MNEPNASPPPPPNLPPANSGFPAATPAPKKSAKPWLWGGCGCLTLLLILGLLCFFFGARYLGLGNTFKRYSGKYDPYKGSLTTLLPDELAGGIVKFRLETKQDITANSKEAGATEAFSFTYDQIGAGVTVKVKGTLVNFPSSERAQTVLKNNAKKYDATPTSKEKGLRFSTKEGETVCWTNGSLLCFAYSGFARPAGNFERAAPF